MDHRDSVASIARTGFPLGVTCQFCLHRALISVADLRARFPEPRAIQSLTFRCTRCKRREVDLQTFWSHSSVRRFMRADD